MQVPRIDDVTQAGGTSFELHLPTFSKQTNAILLELT